MNRGQDSDPIVPFRAIAIADSVSRIDTVVQLWRAFPDVGLALMLRDAAHRRSVVEALAVAAADRCPPGLHVIANACELPRIHFMHLPKAHLLTVSRPPRIPFGVSIHSVSELDDAEAAGASWAVFSPVFPTRSKPGHPGHGIRILEAICSAANIPVFALGGVEAPRVRECLDAGAYGIAAISAFDEFATASELLREIKHAFRS